MPPSRLDVALPFVLRWEGGLVDHPDDPGGRTNRGVTQAVYDAWRAGRGLPQRDVKGIEDGEVQSLYETGYWIPPRCPVLPPELDLAQFDTAVNMGVRRAVRLLQTALGCAVDGVFGDETERAVAGSDLGAVLKCYCDAREDYYRRLVAAKPRMAVFLKGWLNRLTALRQAVGLPGYETRGVLDFGDTGYIGKVPEGPEYDF